MNDGRTVSLSYFTIMGDKSINITIIITAPSFIILYVCLRWRYVKKDSRMIAIVLDKKNTIAHVHPFSLSPLSLIYSGATWNYFHKKKKMMGKAYISSNAV